MISIGHPLVLRLAHVHAVDGSVRRLERAKDTGIRQLEQIRDARRDEVNADSDLGRWRWDVGRRMNCLNAPDE
jgi:hypothetical protein